jgi:hypothetical protein
MALCGRGKRKKNEWQMDGGDRFCDLDLGADGKIYFRCIYLPREIEYEAHVDASLSFGVAR